MSANDMQVGGSHYRSDYEPWDFTCDIFKGCFFLGNANKYITRWRKKNGLEDLRKALHYLQKHRELTEQSRLHPGPWLSTDALNALLTRYAEANRLTLWEEEILMLMGRGLIIAAMRRLEQLIREVESGQA